MRALVFKGHGCPERKPAPQMIRKEASLGKRARLLGKKACFREAAVQHLDEKGVAHPDPANPAWFRRALESPAAPVGVVQLYSCSVVVPCGAQRLTLGVPNVKTYPVSNGIVVARWTGETLHLHVTVRGPCALAAAQGA